MKTNKKYKRISFLKLANDFLMIVFAISAMTGRYIENPIHETMGIFLVLTIIIHAFQHLNWFKNMFQETYRWRRILSSVTILFLLLTAVALCLHGVMMSRTWFAFIGFKSSLTIRQIHTTAAYWMLILTGIHTGIHWTKVKGMLKRQLRVPQAPGWFRYFSMLVEIFIVVAGILAFLDRDVFARIFMVYAFDFWNPEQSFAKILFSYLSISGCFAIVTHKVWSSFGKWKIKDSTESKTTEHEF